MKIINFILSLITIPLQIIVLFSTYNMYYTLVGFELPKLDWRNLFAILILFSAFDNKSRYTKMTVIYNNIRESKSKDEKDEEDLTITISTIIVYLLSWLFAYIFKITLF